MIVDFLTPIASVFVALIVAGIGVFKWLLPIAWNVYDKNVDRAHSRELVELTSSLKVHADSLAKSVEIANQVSGSYRDKTFEAVTLLWDEIIRIERDFSPLAVVVSLLTEDELLKELQAPEKSRPWIKDGLSKFQGKQFGSDILEPMDTIISTTPAAVGLGVYPARLTNQCLFVDAKTMEIYHTIRRIYGRLAYTVSKPTKSNSPTYWMDDEIMNQIVLTVLSDEEWNKIKMSGPHAFQRLMNTLNHRFIQQAKKDLRGMEEIADRTDDIRQLWSPNDVKDWAGN